MPARSVTWGLPIVCWRSCPLATFISLSRRFIIPLRRAAWYFRRLGLSSRYAHPRRRSLLRSLAFPASPILAPPRKGNQLSDFYVARRCLPAV
ncbi:hypothetical protein KCP75_08835 [Salmonella enterica subsp. enterica]|nr:hypothetical protein KCP75_08835 [Salmonella enterica subsp. enterica]